MCDGGAISGPTIAALVSGAAAVTGGLIQHKSSQEQQAAQASAQLDETRRQSGVMRNNMQLQDRQREDAQRTRERFEEETLPAFTRGSLDQDQATEQTRLQAALTQAGNRALTPSTGDASAASASVTTGGSPAAPSVTSRGFQSVLGEQIGQAQEFGAGQTRAQAAMAALSRAQQLGGERLQQAGTNINLSNAKLAALNRAIAANGLLGAASGQRYLTESEKAANKGAGLALAGTTLSTLGNVGYSVASGYGNNQQSQPS